MVSDGSITTFSGIRFWPLLPNPDDMAIMDIAHALANHCRFGGHARVFYSVAEHSVRVRRVCAPKDALWGLLHAASEAFLSDVPAPLKALPAFDVYRAAECALQHMIAARFGLPPEQPVSITEADRAMLRIETRDLLPAPRADRWMVQLALTVPEPWSPSTAEAWFLRRFHELSGPSRG